jgi:hypothetical protein
VSRHLLFPQIVRLQIGEAVTLPYDRSSPCTFRQRVVRAVRNLRTKAGDDSRYQCSTLSDNSVRCERIA